MEHTIYHQGKMQIVRWAKAIKRGYNNQIWKR
jgi:hypothetical protein